MPGAGDISFGVKAPISPDAGGNDRYATGSVLVSRELDSGLDVSCPALCPGPITVAICVANVGLGNSKILCPANTGAPAPECTFCLHTAVLPRDANRLPETGLTHGLTATLLSVSCPTFKLSSANSSLLFADLDGSSVGWTVAGASASLTTAATGFSMLLSITSQCGVPTCTFVFVRLSSAPDWYFVSVLVNGSQGDLNSY